MPSASTPQTILKQFLASDQAHIFSADDIYAIFTAIMNGEWDASQIASLLTFMAQQGERIEDITGAARALRAKASTIKAPIGAVDCCGTGGDGASTLNISSAVAFVLAGAGIPVAKHGNRAASSKSGAADVLESLNVPLTENHTVLEEALARFNYCFLMAPHHHEAVKHVVPVRKALGFRTVFNLLGPLANPANIENQLIGVFDKKWLRPMAEVLKALGTKRAWLVHGRDGLDEITVTDKTDIVSLNEAGEIKTLTIDPIEYGCPKWTLDDLKGGDSNQNAAALQDLLNGKYTQIGQNAYFDIVCLNAAAVFTMMDKTPDLQTGIAMAINSIVKGEALETLINYTAFLNDKNSIV